MYQHPPQNHHQISPKLNSISVLPTWSTSNMHDHPNYHRKTPPQHVTTSQKHAKNMPPEHVLNKWPSDTKFEVKSMPWDPVQPYPKHAIPRVPSTRQGWSIIKHRQQHEHHQTSSKHHQKSSKIIKNTSDQRANKEVTPIFIKNRTFRTRKITPKVTLYQNAFSSKMTKSWQAQGL